MDGGGGAGDAPDRGTAGARPWGIDAGGRDGRATDQAGCTRARTYRTAGAKTTWNPDSGVRVYADGTEPTVTADKVSMEVPLVGPVGAARAFDPAGAGVCFSTPPPFFMPPQAPFPPQVPSRRSASFPTRDMPKAWPSAACRGAGAVLPPYWATHFSACAAVRL